MSHIVRLAAALALCGTALPVAAAPPPPGRSARASALAAAAERGDVAALEALAAGGVDLDGPLDREDTRAVSLAAVHGRSAALEVLLSRGAFPNPAVRAPALVAAAGGGGAADTVTLAARAGQRAALELLLRYGAALAERGAPALAEAVRRCDARTVELLVRFGAVPTAPLAGETRARCPAGVSEMVDANVPGTAAFVVRWKRIDALRRAALGASKANDHAGALARLEEALGIVARAPGLHRMIAAEHAALGDERRAHDHRARYLELVPGSELSVKVRGDLLASAPAKRALAARIRPPWAVRWRCDGTDLAECRAQCARGNGGSCTEVAKLTYGGKTGGPASPGDARGYFERGCELGNPDACYFVAKAYYNGQLGVAKDLARAEAFAERGCGVDLQLSCHLQGLVSLVRIVEREDPQRSDLDPAIAIFSTMCEQADTLGCGSLGDLLSRDFGFRIDVPRGLTLLDRACREGWAAPCTRLAEIYGGGDGVAPDPAKAAEYQAAAARLPKAGAELPRRTPPRVRAADAAPRTCGTVRERLEAPPYVFLRLETPAGDRWAAGAAAEIRPGALACVRDARAVRDFESAALRRRFDEVLFGTVDAGGR